GPPTTDSHTLSLHDALPISKAGDRKKYFIMNSDTIIQNIDAMVETWSSQKQLHIEIKAYKESVNSKTTDEDSKFDLGFHDNYIQDRKSTRLNSSHVKISYAV